MEKNTGHKCEWELLDDYMAGCTLCGKVHRCDFDVCEEVLIGDSAFQQYRKECEDFIKCPTIQSEHDGSIICTITGSCVRDRAFGIEFEMVANKGLCADDMQKLMNNNGSTGIIFQNHQGYEHDNENDYSHTVEFASEFASGIGMERSFSFAHMEDDYQNLESSNGKKKGRKKRGRKVLDNTTILLHENKKRKKKLDGLEEGQNVCCNNNSWQKQRSQPFFVVKMQVMQGNF